MILIISICAEKLHELEFINPIEDILIKNKKKFLTKHYPKITDADLKKYNKVIICGTGLKDNYFLENINTFNWLKNFEKPVFGICGGAHIIGLILGNKLKKKKEIGLKEIEIKNFLGISGKREVYHLHQFYVLPEIFHKDNFYGTLFHPEVRNREIIENFLNI